jgi:hypothetical protein
VIKRMLENEKYWNNPSIYECNIIHYTVSCWMLGEHGRLFWLNQNIQYIQAWSTKVKLPWNIKEYLKKWRAGDKNRSFLGAGTSLRWVGVGKGEWGEYIFLSIYESGRIKPVKIVLRMVGWRKRENDGGGKSN